MPALLEKSESEPVERKAEVPSLAGAFQGSMGVRSVVLTGLFVLACFYSLYFARYFFIPIVLAFVVTFLLSPIVRALKKIHVPEFIGAGIVILSLLAALGGIAYEVSGPFSQWLARAPEIGHKLSAQLQSLKKPVQEVTSAGEQVKQLAKMDSGEKRPPQRVELTEATFADGLFSWTWNFFLQFAVVLILLYFLLAAGDLFLRKLIHVLPRLEDKKTAVHIARQVEDNISMYLLTVAMINAGLGSAAALVFWALGMPSPLLWGAMAALFNFVPYVGALAIIGITGLVAAATFPSLGHAVLVPAAYFGLATLEGNFITPWILGRRLTLNPVVIFLGLTFWGWLWGIPGALLAVPMLVMFKIFCDHIEPLAPIGEFLGN